MFECGMRDGGDTDGNRFRRGQKGTKIEIDNVDGGKKRSSGHNGVEESIDSEQGCCVGPHIIPRLDLVSPYCPSDSPLPQSTQLVSLLFHNPLKIGGGFRGPYHRK